MARENTGILMRCGRCLQQSVVSEMKYAKDGTTLVCTNCRGLSIQEHLEKLRRKGQSISISLHQVQQQSTRAPAAASPFLARI
jgi:transcription elongation factor Elf1